MQNQPLPDGPGTPSGPPAGTALEQAAALGLPLLAEALAMVEDGIAVVDAGGLLVYANPAACQMLGRPLDQLRGSDLLDTLRTGEHAKTPDCLPWEPGAKVAPFDCFVQGPVGAEREVSCSFFAADVAGRPHWVAILRDLSHGRAMARTAAALAQTTAQLVGAGTVEEILTGIARHAVESTDARACGIVVVGEDHKLVVAGGHGFPDAIRSMNAWTSGSISLDEMPGGTVILSGRSVVLPEARSVWAATPVMQAFEASLEGMDWEGGFYVPLSWDGEVFGVFGLYLPSGMSGPSAEESAFYGVLADQAAVAVTNARLAASMERTRLARELHDSISQALFSMTMHARTAQLAMVKTGLDETGPLGRSVAQLAELTRGTLAEMRALIFELRPGALAEEGLVSALGKLGAALTAREQVAITVAGPVRRLDLEAGAEEHLYRITSEALNNVVKHARAGRASVDVSAEDGELRIVVSDDGTGFDPGAEHSGSIGLSSMAERAEAVGAAFTLTSTPGTGTVVTVTLPHRRREQEDRGPDAR